MMRLRRSLPFRVAKGFAIFWWDFLVGDTPELFVAALAIVGIIALCRVVWRINVLALVALPVLCVLALALSVRRAQRQLRKE
jgi:hypothetical protein